MQISARYVLDSDGPAADLKARPITARGPELSLGPGPLHAEARPDKNSLQGISWNYSIDLFLNGFVSINTKRHGAYAKISYRQMNKQAWKAQLKF